MRHSVISSGKVIEKAYSLYPFCAALFSGKVAMTIFSERRVVASRDIPA